MLRIWAQLVFRRCILHDSAMQQQTMVHRLRFKFVSNLHASQQESLGERAQGTSNRELT